MKKIAVLKILLLITYPLIAQAPVFEWAAGTQGFINSESVAVNSSGIAYTTGSFSGTVDFDPGPGTYNLTSAGSLDIFISSMGWAVKIGSSQFQHATAITVDNNDNIYVTGYFGGPGSVDFDPGIPVNNLSNGGASQYEVFVLKFDPSLQLQWAKKMGDANNSSDMGYAIDVDDSGNVYTVGTFTQSCNFNPGGVFIMFPPSTSEQIFVSKLDANGNFVWARQLGGTGIEEPSAIEVDNNGNVYTTGFFYGTADFDPGPGIFNLTSTSGKKSFISKLDANGDFVWAKQMEEGTSADGGGKDIEIDTNGNIYTTGFFSGVADFDPGVGVFNLSSPSSEDIFVSKLDSSGNLVWVQQMGGAGSQHGWNIALGDGGYIYTAGRFEFTSDFDPDTGTFNFTSAGSKDIFISKLNGSGDFVWAGQIGSTGTDEINSMTFSNGGLYSTGQFTGTVDFDPGVSTYNLTVTSGAYVLKLSDCISISQPSFISGSDTVCAGSNQIYSVTLDPSATSYTWTLPGGWTGTSTTNTITTDVGPTGGNISVTANNSCGSSTLQTLAVTANSLPAVTANATDNNICDGDPTTLTGDGASSYIWTGGVIDGVSFIPGSTATYTVTGTDTNSCSNTNTIVITVNTLPNVAFVYPGNDTVCISYGSQTLSGGSPAGGTYSGTGVTGTSFDPNVAGVGNHTITYSYTDVNSCTNTYNITITVLGCNEIENNSNQNILVYPNPFTNSIKLNGIKGTTEVKIYNALGEIMGNWIITETNNIIITENLPSGIYFFNIGSTSKKIIKY